MGAAGRFSPAVVSVTCSSVRPSCCLWLCRWLSRLLSVSGPLASLVTLCLCASWGRMSWPGTFPWRAEVRARAQATCPALGVRASLLRGLPLRKQLHSLGTSAAPVGRAGPFIPLDRRAGQTLLGVSPRPWEIRLKCKCCFKCSNC